MVYGNARIFDDALVQGDARVYGNALIFDKAQVSDCARIYGNTLVCGNAKICGYARIYDNVRITDTADYLGVGPLGSRNDFTTFFKTRKGIRVTCGCFRGSLAKFTTKIEEIHKDNPRFLAQYRAAIKFADTILQLDG
jgi:hypothetical protein